MYIERENEEWMHFKNVCTWSAMIEESKKVGYWMVEWENYGADQKQKTMWICPTEQITGCQGEILESQLQQFKKSRKVWCFEVKYMILGR